MTQIYKMKCKYCNFENQHDGIYCTDCGSNFLEITYPHVCYFIRSMIHLKTEIRNPFHGNVQLQKIVLDDTKIDKKMRIGLGRAKDETNFEYNSRNVLEPKLTFIFEKGEALYPISDIVHPFYLSPVPKILIESVAGGEKLFMSPTTGFVKQFKVKLINNAIVRIDGIYLIKGEDEVFDPFKKNQSSSFWTHFLPIEEKNIELRSIGSSSEPVEAIITVDFSPLKEEVLDQEFYLSIRNEFGANKEIYHESEKQKIRLEYRNLVPLTLGVYHASDKGFVFVADNHVVRGNPDRDSDEIVLIGQHIQDCIDITNWKEKFADDRSVEERLTDFNTQVIKFNIPVAKKRKRQFSLYQNYLQELADNYDLENNESYLIITPSNGQSNEKLPADSISYKQLKNEGKVTDPVLLGNELALVDIREFNAFEVIFNFPEDTADTEYVFDLSILRKNKATSSVVDTLNYSLIIRTYHPEPLPGYQFIAIDFGTSNSCVVGPPILHGEILDGDPVWYPINHYHEISDQVSTFPTRLAYEELANYQLGEAYIPDSIKLADLKFIYEKFKINLPDELAEEEEGKESSKSIDSLKLTIDFLSAVLTNLEIFFEDRNCLENIFSNIKLTAPTGFIPEIREKIEVVLEDYLSSNNPYDTEYDIEMNLDEPEAVLIYAYSTNTDDKVDFVYTPDQIELFGVYDFGGGTTDTSFILIDDELTTMVGTGGSVRVGGTTVDRWLAKRFTMSDTLSDALRAKNFNLSEDHLREGKVENQFTRTPQSSLEISKIKHKFNVQLDEKVEIPQELLTEFPFDKGILFDNDEDYEALQEQIRTVIMNSKAREKLDVDFWKERSNLFIHLLLPFYTCLFRKIDEIMRDTLKESFEDSGVLPENPVKKTNITLLLAGNASKIAFMAVLVEKILENLKTKYPFINNIKIRLLNNPKEAVGLGAYYATQAGEANIQKLNNPPMVVFVKMNPFPPRKDVVDIGNEKGIIIFNEGEKSRNPEWGDVLVKVYATRKVGSGPIKPHLPVSKKIGIDILSSQQKIKGDKLGDKLAFVLTLTNRLEIFRFSDPNDLMETEAFQKAIKGDNVNLEYIQKQLGL